MRATRATTFERAKTLPRNYRLVLWFTLKTHRRIRVVGPWTKSVDQLQREADRSRAQVGAAHERARV